MVVCEQDCKRMKNKTLILKRFGLKCIPLKKRRRFENKNKK